MSLFGPAYNDRPNGNRRDLMEMMAAMKPTLLRLPGGNCLEGDTFAQRFDWKKTIGAAENRPGHRSPWNYWYRASFRAVAELYQEKLPAYSVSVPDFAAR